MIHALSRICFALCGLIPPLAASSLPPQKRIADVTMEEIASSELTSLPKPFILSKGDSSEKTKETNSEEPPFVTVEASSIIIPKGAKKPIDEADFKTLWDGMPDKADLRIGSSLNLFYIDRAGATSLAEMLTMDQRVRCLRLVSVGLDDACIPILANALHHNKTIQVVDLSMNHISTGSAEDLANALITNQTIEELNLTSNRIDDSGVKALSRVLKSNQTLRILNLQNNYIGDRGAIDLADGLKINKKLQELNLSHNKIGDQGAIALANILEKNNRTLRLLNILSNYDMTDISEQALSKTFDAHPGPLTLQIRDISTYLHNIKDSIRASSGHVNH